MLIIRFSYFQVKMTAENLQEAMIRCSREEKDYYLYYFIKSHPGRTIVSLTFYLLFEKLFCHIFLITNADFVFNLVY